MRSSLVFTALLAFASAALASPIEADKAAVDVSTSWTRAAAKPKVSGRIVVKYTNNDTALGYFAKAPRSDSFYYLTKSKSNAMVVKQPKTTTGTTAILNTNPAVAQDPYLYLSPVNRSTIGFADDSYLNLGPSAYNSDESTGTDDQFFYDPKTNEITATYNIGGFTPPAILTALNTSQLIYTAPRIEGERLPPNKGPLRAFFQRI